MEQIQWKFMTKIFFNLNNPIFGPFPNFCGKKSFPKNWAVMHNFIKVSNTMPKLREI